MRISRDSLIFRAAFGKIDIHLLKNKFTSSGSPVTPIKSNDERLSFHPTNFSYFTLCIALRVTRRGNIQEHEQVFFFFAENSGVLEERATVLRLLSVSFFGDRATLSNRYTILYTEIRETLEILRPVPNSNAEKRKRYRLDS